VGRGDGGEGEDLDVGGLELADHVACVKTTGEGCSVSVPSEQWIWPTHPYYR